MIELRSVSKNFGRFTALRDVSLAIQAGEAVALWGPNGAGKTTLIRCILGLVPFKGEISIDGLSVRRRGRSVRRLIGYVPQEATLFDGLRVFEVISLFARIKRTGKDAALAALESSGLQDHVKKRVRDLSGGMKQRLTLALALLSEPPILILDEPTSSLDANGRRALLDRVDLLRSDGKTVLFISHRPEEVRDVADRIITLESGRIVRDDPGRIKSESSCRSLAVSSSEASRSVDVLAAAGIEAQIEERAPFSRNDSVPLS